VADGISSSILREALLYRDVNYILRELSKITLIQRSHSKGSYPVASLIVSSVE